jgi:hypothetical protein
MTLPVALDTRFAKQTPMGHDVEQAFAREAAFFMQSDRFEAAALGVA